MHFSLNLILSAIIFLACVVMGVAVGCLPYFIGMLIDTVQAEPVYRTVGWISCFVTIPIGGVAGMYISAVLIACLWNPDDGKTAVEDKDNGDKIGQL